MQADNIRYWWYPTQQRVHLDGDWNGAHLCGGRVGWLDGYQPLTVSTGVKPRASVAKMVDEARLVCPKCAQIWQDER